MGLPLPTRPPESEPPSQPTRGQKGESRHQTANDPKLPPKDRNRDIQQGGKPPRRNGRGPLSS